MSHHVTSQPTSTKATSAHDTLLRIHINVRSLNLDGCLEEDFGLFVAACCKHFPLPRAVHQDPNWQDMLADELQRAEEELNNWSLFGRSKNPGRLPSEVLEEDLVLRSFDSAAKFARLSSQAEE